MVVTEKETKEKHRVHSIVGTFQKAVPERFHEDGKGRALPCLLILSVLDSAVGWRNRGGEHA